MFRVTRYPMISKTESGRVRYRKKYGVAGRVRVPAGHWLLQLLLLLPVQDPHGAQDAHCARHCYQESQVNPAMWDSFVIKVQTGESDPPKVFISCAR